MSPSETIGEYRIIGVLGEGGSGVVYEAEQQHPRRRVALKVMRQGHLVDELHAQMFKREAETLGRLKHPNIAAIYESGHTEDGHDYFAMEMVRGRTLSRWLAERPKRVTQNELELRLRLFQTVCEAVHYAHQRGVIHRDLKPANIVVADDRESSSASGSQPQAPLVKILDFGLARVTDLDEAATQVSRLGVIKGTLPYMSPEQARGENDAIDVRTDVYALGVILYELLVGERPYETSRGALVEAVRVICEEAPRSLCETWKGVRKLDRDVETIVGKALEKEPERRYASALAMAEDVERYLSSQPISARPPSATYQIRKFARRNRVLVTAGATALVVLVGFAAAMTFQAGRISRERDRANREARAAGQISDFMIGLFEASDPTRSRGQDVTAREMLEAGADRLQELGGQPRTQARFREAIGHVYLLLGLYDQAEEQLLPALETRERFAASDELELAKCLHMVANLYDGRGDPESAEELVVRSAEIRERLLGEHPDLADSLNTLGNVLWHTDRLMEAEEIHRRALAIRELLLDPGDTDIAQSLHNIGALRYFAGDLAEAERLYKRSAAIEEAAHGPDDWNLATTLHTLAIVYQDQRRLDEALALERRSLAVREKVLGPEHPYVALSLTTLGNILRGLDRAAEAEPAIRRAVEIADASWGTEHPEEWWMRRSLARTLVALERYEEAELLLQNLLETVESSSTPGHAPDTLATLGELYLAAGRLDRAGAVYRQAVVLLELDDPTDPSIGLSCAGLAETQRLGGRFAEAEASYRKAISLMEAGWGPADPDLQEARQGFAALLRELGRESEAAELEAEFGSPVTLGTA